MLYCTTPLFFLSGQNKSDGVGGDAARNAINRLPECRKVDVSVIAAIIAHSDVRGVLCLALKHNPL